MRLHWEFWPYQVFYGPIYLRVLGDMVRSGHVAYMTAADPGFDIGAFIDYSKAEIQAQLPQELVPRTLILATESERDLLGPRAQAAYPVADRSPEALGPSLAATGLGFPLIFKPDRGERGTAVANVKNPAEALGYLQRVPGPILVQEIARGPAEFGLLYTRMPGADGGTVTSVVIKEPLSVTGDGRRTLDQLMEADERCRLHLPMLRTAYAEELPRVLQAGELRVLTDIGNHARGTTFRSGQHLRGPALDRFVEDFAQGIPGFHLGRFDIRAPSWESMLAGDFRIVELNGSASEPAHIYDSRRSLLRAWRDLYRHWILLGRIARANIRAGYRPVSGAELLRRTRAGLSRRKAS